MVKKSIENSMFFRRNDGAEIFCWCNCIMDSQINYDPEVEIPCYNTIEEAHKAGWIHTNHIKFCDPDKPAQWVCPECSKGFDWGAETRIITRSYDNRTLMYANRGLNGK